MTEGTPARYDALLARLDKASLSSWRSTANGANVRFYLSDADPVAEAAAAIRKLLAEVQDGQGAGFKAGLDAATQACETQRAEFLSPQYATPQPIGSLMERFACGECIAVIRAINPTTHHHTTTTNEWNE